MAPKLPNTSAPPDNEADDSGPSESNPPEETMGGSKKGSGGLFGRAYGAPEHSNSAAKVSEAMQPSTSGEDSVTDSSEQDVGPDGGPRPDLFRAGLPAQTRNAKEV